MTNSDASSQLEAMLSRFQKANLELAAETDPVFVRQVIETTANLALLKNIVDSATGKDNVESEVEDCLDGLREAFFLMLRELAPKAT